MNRQDLAPIDWRRTIRLLGALRLSRRWQEAALGLLVCLVLMASMLSALQSEPGRAMSHGVFMTMLLVFVMVAWSAVANAGWLYLPVSNRERRAATWLAISVVPFLFLLASCLLALAAIAIAGGHADLDRALSLFGFQGLVAQAIALGVIVLGKGPQAWAGQGSSRQGTASALVLIGVLIAVFVVAARFGGRVAAIAGFGLPLAMAALAASAMLLPLTLRFARLEPAADVPASEELAWYERPRATGYHGYFALEARRSVGLAVVLLASVLTVTWIFPFASFAENRGDEGPSPLTAFSSSWIGPAMLSLGVMFFSLQLLMRGRRALLSLPRGDKLLMATPAVSVIVTYMPVAPVAAWGEVQGASAMLLHLVAGALVALGLGYVWLAGLLRVTTTVGIVVVSAVICALIGLLGASAAISQHVPGYFAKADPLFGAIGALLLGIGFLWSHSQLRSTRAPYRPWPGARSRWNAA